MANSALTSLDSIATTTAKTLHRDDARVLATLAPGQSAVVTSVDVEADMAAWLAAVGIACGDRITVLRRGAFGGPIHLRTAAGGEFAIARSLACSIATSPIAEPRV